MDDEKEFIEAVLQAGRQAGIAPLRVIVKTAQIIEADVNNGTVEKEATRADYQVEAAGLIDGKLVQYAGAIIDQQAPATIVDALLNAPQSEYKDSWFTKPGARLGKADTYAAKLAEIPHEIVTKSALKICRSLLDSLPAHSLASALATHTNGHVTFGSTDNLFLTYKENAYQVGGKATVKGADGQTYQVAETKTFYKNLDLLDEVSIGKQIAIQAVNQAQAQTVPAGTYQVLLAPKAAANFLSLAVSHLAGQRIYHHESVYDGQIGKDVFSDQLTVLNDPFIASGKARPFDGEGTPTEKFMAVDHGRLRCYLLDNEYGEKLAQKSNGCHTPNGCEAQYLVVTPADVPAQRLQSEIKEGLLISEITDLSGLNRQTLAFKVPFVGFAIHNGSRGEPIKGLMEGKVADVVKNITKISREREDRFGCLCPWFALDELKIVAA